MARLLVLAIAAMVPIACSGGSGLAKVTGKVTYKGQPVPKGTVAFQSTAPDGRNATGAIGENGYYTLQTENPADGALPGDYNVTISARDDVILDYIPLKPPPPKRLAPAKYEKAETSGLKATVKSGSNTFDFDLTD